jgi:hypothetical protein
MPSTGYVRIYFMEPTSVEIDTGITGGRITTADGSKTFMFSEVEGFIKLPEPSSGEDDPRDIRLVRSLYDAGISDFKNTVEIIGDNRPDVYGLEILNGDLFEIHEQIPFRCSTSGAHTSYTFPKMSLTSGPTFVGIAGSGAGLRTQAGSNRVRVPDTSLIDFFAMDTADGLIGQYLVIESGPDMGKYIIEEVLSAKSLRLSQVMVGTTENYWEELHALPDPLVGRDATLTPSGTKTVLQDSTDGGPSGIGTQIGHYITIFEAQKKEIEGTYEITDVDVPNNKVTLDFSVGGVVTTGKFSWVRTALKENVEYKFNIYKFVPAKYEVIEVAAVEGEIAPVSATGEVLGSSPPYTRLQDLIGSPFAGVVRGDRLEIFFGNNVGVYTVASVTNANNIDVYPYHSFPVKESGQFYRIDGGIHGARKMVRIKPTGGAVGPLPLGTDLPYIIRRAKVFRVSTTEMQNYFDGALYYVDVPIESEGAGDPLNLPVGERMLVASRMRVDGYRYSVLNNTLTFSPYERVSANFAKRFLPKGNSDSPTNMNEVSGKNLKIIYETSTTAGLVNDLMRADTERPVNANPIARHYLPAFLYTTLEYTGGLPASSTGPEIESYVNDLPSSEPLEVSELEAFLTRRGATYVKHPIELVSITHDIDRSLIVDRSFDQISEVGISFNGTSRISSFFAKIGEGLNVTRK